MPHLCGYRKGFNTENALLTLLERWKSCLEKKGFCGTNLMNLSKAFQLVNCVFYSITDTVCKEEWTFNFFDKVDSQRYYDYDVPILLSVISQQLLSHQHITLISCDFDQIKMMTWGLSK